MFRDVKVFGNLRFRPSTRNTTNLSFQKSLLRRAFSRAAVFRHKISVLHRFSVDRRPNRWINYKYLFSFLWTGPKCHVRSCVRGAFWFIWNILLTVCSKAAVIISALGSCCGVILMLLTSHSGYTNWLGPLEVSHKTLTHHIHIITDNCQLMFRCCK